MTDLASSLIAKFNEQNARNRKSTLADVRSAISKAQQALRMPGQSSEGECASGIVMDPQELLTLGKRHMLLDEYATAVEYFGNACQQLSGKHGDLGKECAPAYLMYGRCLLEMARQNLSVLEPESAKAKGADEKKDEAGPSAEKLADATEENEGNSEESEDESEEDAEDEKNGVDSKEEEVQGNGDSSESPKKDEEGEGDEEDEEDEEADSYLKLAWTFLDLAKVIFLKEKSVEGDFAAADCLMALGEVSMEGGNCDAGVKDMREAIHLRRLHSGRCDRIVAGSEYELGAALHQFQRYDDALVSLKECLTILTELSDKVAEKLKATTDKEDEDNLISQSKEFTELINDVKDKIAEVEEERSMRDIVKTELAEKALAKVAEAQAAGEATTEKLTTTVVSGEIKTLTARRKPAGATDASAVASPARLPSSLASSLIDDTASPATKSRVAALISAQLKRHRVDSPSTNGSGNNCDAPVKRPASSNGQCNGQNGTESCENRDADDEGVSSKRIRAEEPKSDASNNHANNDS